MEDIDDELPWDYNSSAQTLWKKQATAMSSQQAESCGPQTMAPLQLLLQAPGHPPLSTHSVLHSQPSQMPQGLALASVQNNSAYQTPQPLQHQRASLQQQQLAYYQSQPPKQQMPGPGVHGGYTAPYSTDSLLSPINRRAEPHGGPGWMRGIAHGPASQSRQAELAPAALQPPEQPATYPYAPLPNTAAAAAARAAQWDPSSLAEMVRSQPPSIALGTAQAAASAPVASAAGAAAAAAAVSEMPLERYIDLHAALERGTGSVQSFSAVEAGMFRMADLKQVAALHGLAAGSKTKQVLLERMKGLRLLSPSVAEGTLAQAERERQSLPAQPVSGADLVSLGWVSPGHAGASSAGLRKAQVLERVPQPQQAAAGPVTPAQQLPSPAETASMASGAAADKRTGAMQAPAVRSPQSHSQPTGHANAAAQIDRPSHESPSSEHNRPADLLEALLGVDCAATTPGATQPLGQHAQPDAAQRQGYMAESDIQHTQVDTQAVKESARFTGSLHKMSAAATAVPEAADSDAFREPVQARSPAQAHVNYTSACQAQPAAAGVQEAAAQPEQWRTTLPGTAAGRVVSHPGQGSEAPMQPSSSAGMPPTAAAPGEAALQAPAGSQEAAQPEVQPGAWRAKRKAETQSPCIAEPPASAAALLPAEVATAGAVPIQDGAPADVQEPSAEQSQLQSGSLGDSRGSGPAQDAPAWLLGQVRELAERSTGTPKVTPDASSIGSLVGRSVAFVLLAVVDADEEDSVPAGLHSGRVIEVLMEDHPEDVCPPDCNQEHAFHYVRLLTGAQKAVHIDLKLDLHESLRQAMPMDLLGISSAALQDAWVLLEPCEGVAATAVAAAEGPPAQSAGKGDSGRLRPVAVKGRGRGRGRGKARVSNVAKQRASRPHTTPKRFT